MTSSSVFAVLPEATVDGHMVFGKNSDRPAGEPQEIIFQERQRFSSDRKQKCTYIEIDSVPETFAVILSKPWWMWGAEMGSNEFGLCIGNSSILANKLISETDSQKKLLAMDLVRLGLERAKTASEAIDVITGLLKTYGQGGSCQSCSSPDLICYSGFLIVDPLEAWVIETVGSEFIAEKVEQTLFRNLGNCYTIGKKFDKISDNLKEIALQNNLWDGKVEFDFAEIFNQSLDTDDTQRSRFESGKKLLEQFTQDKNFDIKSMIKVLRNQEIYNKFDDEYPTMSSQASELSANVKERPSVHWFTGTPDPEYSYFKPFIFHPKVRMASEKTKSPSTADDSSSWDVDHRHTLYRKHEEFYERLRNDSALHQALRQLENLCIDELQQMLKSGYNEMDDNDNEIENLFSDSVESELRFYR